MKFPLSSAAPGPRRSALHRCILAAIGFAASGTTPARTPHELDATAPPPASMSGGSVMAAYLRAEALHSDFAKHVTAGMSHPVTSCLDDGTPGTLRSVIADSMTHSGDTIDLTQLPMSCSKITLTQHNAILVSQDSLYLQGPGADSLSIDANAESGVFLHLGAGTLYVSDVTIANGNLSASTSVGGGCVASAGSVFLNDAVVTSCQLTSTSGTANDSAKGGGIYVSHSLFMIRSKISDSHASTSSLALARGGGAYAYENIVALDSTIVGNSATTQAAIFTEAGGFRAKGTADIERSTISGNSAQYYGALRINGGFISDSTISGNSADKFYGGVGSGGALTISNSTIAFNHARQPALGSGLYAWGTLTLTSSIIADNTGPGGSTDLYAFLGNVTAHDNLVVSSNIALPLDNTVGVCPKLDILANSGGFTATHGLLTDSPAIDHGSGTVTVDQRGLPRMSGAAVDIGAFERQPTDKPDRIFTNGLEGFCDQ